MLILRLRWVSLSPPLCHPLSILPTCGLAQRQLPLPLSLAGEGGLLPHQGRLPEAAAVRSRQGGEKKGRREGGGVGEGGGESCTFLRAERASPRRGPSPRSCLPSPGPPTWQQQHCLLPSPTAMLGAAPHRALDPSCSPLAWQVCGEGPGQAHALVSDGKCRWPGDS